MFFQGVSSSLLLSLELKFLKLTYLLNHHHLLKWFESFALKSCSNCSD